MKLRGSQYSARAAGTHAKLKIDRGCGELGAAKKKAHPGRAVAFSCERGVELDVLADLPKG